MQITKKTGLTLGVKKGTSCPGGKGWDAARAPLKNTRRQGQLRARDITTIFWDYKEWERSRNQNYNQRLISSRVFITLLKKKKKKLKEKEKTQERIHTRPKAQTGSYHILQSWRAVNILHCLNTSKATGTPSMFQNFPHLLTPHRMDQVWHLQGTYTVSKPSEWPWTMWYTQYER